ncbi:MAG: MgtC/SapB family protein [candidate division Zixibacteria bacterium]|jgi:putative Mg2+ transporter-C (MgtC) family protein|nr:MgtC/SapB family protein [candidate division Zixibacteria bacterium]
MELNWSLMLHNLYHLAIAYALALPIALNRESSVKSAGLRTFPLVAVASCGFMLIGIDVLSTTDAESRVIYGIATGIGFIGGGAILKTKGSVSGTATAASIWNVGAIGVAVAWGKYEIALVLSLLNFVTLSIGKRFKKSLKSSQSNSKTEE